MSDGVIAPVGDELVLSPGPWQRVLLVFTSPSRAFAAPRIGGGWWAPLLLLILVTLGYMAVVGSRVGWDTVTRNALATSPAQQAKLQQLPPEQQQTQMQLVVRITRISSYIGAAIGTPLFAAIVAGVLLGTLNFGFGGHATYGALFSVYLLSALPQLIKLVLAAALLLAGVGTDSFLLSDPLGSNPAYYLRGGGAPHGLLAVLTWADVFLVWEIVLLVIGCAAVARLSRSKAAAAVCGWVFLLVVATGGWAALH